VADAPAVGACCPRRARDTGLTLEVAAARVAQISAFAGTASAEQRLATASTAQP
jgi:hypothetical protein